MTPPRKPLALALAAVEARPLPGGGLVLRSPLQPCPYARCVGEWLRTWAAAAPERVFLAEVAEIAESPRNAERTEVAEIAEAADIGESSRNTEIGESGGKAGVGKSGQAAASGGSTEIADGGSAGDAESGGAGNRSWRRIGFGATLAAVERIAGALVARGLDGGRPIAILSENSIDNALLQLGAMHVGIPVVPISPAYSLLSQDHAKLRSIVGLTAPALIYAADGAAYAAALAAARAALACADGTAGADGADGGHGADSVELVVSARPPGGLRVTAFADLLARQPGPEVARRFAAVGPDTTAKVLFTSGSTGTPKGVVTTQRMLCSNQEAVAQIWPFLDERPPRIVDWLPWSHTFGGSHNFNMMLRHGGTLTIDRGKPIAGAFETTVANLREVPSTIYFNVPRGYDMLVPFLETDAVLRDCFFRDLDLLVYAAASLPHHLWQALERLSVVATGRRITMLSAWGLTETAPSATHVHFPIERAGIIGLPIPGTEIKLAPAGAKLELRVRGPNVTPGYWQQSPGPRGNTSPGDGRREESASPSVEPIEGQQRDSEAKGGERVMGRQDAGVETRGDGMACQTVGVEARDDGMGRQTAGVETPGHGFHELLPAALDEEGFLRTGDAGKLADPGDPARGLVFDGRLAEEFKLTSGTWVQVGELRLAVIAACAPVVSDVVVAGHDQPAIGVLLFPNPAGCLSLCPGAAPDLPLGALIRRPEVRERLGAGLAAHNAENPVSSRRVHRALLLEEPPSIDAGEITDKGYINQRAVLDRRAALVARLGAGGNAAADDDPEVLRLD